ncbi:MAG TPA: dihydroorotate dehydrogenase electron transfer subunit [Candidatus Kapabacteria bacterium]|nr:dihydroorotate dehydrogenase electron transfer subunit [Candidatus Kapabacteria bacterium]
MQQSAQRRYTVTGRTEIAPGLVVLSFHAPEIARTTRAGQFVNVLPKVGQQDPMLRRPFSVYGVDGENASVIVQAIGRGTNVIANTQVGELLDVLGPLGNPWMIDSGDYTTAVLIIGGVGVASMPLLTRDLAMRETPVRAFYGSRSADLFARQGLTNVTYCTDDGSEGYHGTNIQALREALDRGEIEKPKLFVCGPTGMMKAAARLAEEYNIPCELSLETEMACGVGICQGCPVPTDEATFLETGKRFRLVCMEGPSFAHEKIAL